MDQEAGFMANFISSYFIALGVLLGGALIGGLGAYLSGEPPLTAITKLANRLKIWRLSRPSGEHLTRYTVSSGGCLKATRATSSNSFF